MRRWTRWLFFVGVALFAFGITYVLTEPDNSKPTAEFKDVRSLSTALRNLDDEGCIKLIVRGDMANPMRLSADTSHKVQAFQAVVLNSGASS